MSNLLIHTLLFMAQDNKVFCALQMHIFLSIQHPRLGVLHLQSTAHKRRISGNFLQFLIVIDLLLVDFFDVALETFKTSLDFRLLDFKLLMQILLNALQDCFLTIFEAIHCFFKLVKDNVDDFLLHGLL